MRVELHTSTTQHKELQMTYTATFSNGTTISRNSKRNFTHAYIVKNQWNTFTGFASSEESAKKSATMQHGTVEFCEIVAVSIQQ
jgi:hypothetical protein